VISEDYEVITAVDRDEECRWSEDERVTFLLDHKQINNFHPAQLKESQRPDALIIHQSVPALRCRQIASEANGCIPIIMSGEKTTLICFRLKSLLLEQKKKVEKRRYSVVRQNKKRTQRSTHTPRPLSNGMMQRISDYLSKHPPKMSAADTADAIIALASNVTSGRGSWSRSRVIEAVEEYWHGKQT
jgi:hypothetical protein